MKYILTSLLGVHGLIHALGFAKAFGLSQPPQLQLAISRPVGLMWLVASLLFLLSGGSVLPGKRWWRPAACAVLISQVLILGTWSDAKAGSIVNVMLLFPILLAALGTAPWSYRALYDREITARLSDRSGPSRIVTEADIAHLPPAVQRYMTFVGAVGKPRVWSYRLRFRGALRNGPGDHWMPMTAEQHSFVDGPARLFLITSSMFGVPFTAFHRYVGPQATFSVRLASLVTVVDARGPQMNRSETVTLLNDMFLLAPPSLIDARIEWQELDPMTVRATWTNAGNTVSAVASFSTSGELVNFVSDDRFRTVNGKAYERLRWSTPVSRWHEYEGRRVISAGEALWGPGGHEFAYARIELLDIQYN